MAHSLRPSRLLRPASKAGPRCSITQRAPPSIRTGGIFASSKLLLIIRRPNSPRLLTLHRIDDPASASFPLFEGRTCVLVNAPGGNCTVGGYPAYVVNVTTVAQIQLAVNFARNANLRLVIKNKGHDYNAKSTGGGGLSVFTNHLRDVRFIPSYSQGGYEGPAFKVGVGAEVGTLYEYADTLNLSVVGGLGKV